MNATLSEKKKRKHAAAIALETANGGRPRGRYDHILALQRAAGNRAIDAFLQADMPATVESVLRSGVGRLPDALAIKSGPVSASAGTAVGSGPKVDDESWAARLQSIEKALAEELRGRARTKVQEGIGAAKGVITQATEVIDTGLWVGGEYKEVRDKAARAIGGEEGTTGNKLAKKTIDAMANLIPGFGGLSAAADAGDQLKAWGLVDKYTGQPSLTAPLTEKANELVKWTEEAIGGTAGDPEMFTPAEKAEIASSIGVQVALAFTGVEEVKIAMNVVGALAGLRGIVESVREPKSPRFWGAIIGLVLSIVGLKHSLAATKITTLVLKYGWVAAAVPPMTQLVADYLNTELAEEERERRMKQNWIQVVHVLKDAILHVAQSQGGKSAAPKDTRPATPTRTSSEVGVKTPLPTKVEQPPVPTSTTGTPSQSPAPSAAAATRRTAPSAELAAPGDAPAVTMAGSAKGGPPPSGTRAQSATTGQAAHDQWIADALKNKMDTRPPPLPKPGAPPVKVGETRYDLRSMEEAVRVYDDFRARAPGREVGVYRNASTGEYAVVAGREGSVRGPLKGEPSAWDNVLHNHPNPENALTFRNPAPQDLSGSIPAVARGGRPVTTLIEHDVPGGGRRFTAVTVTPPEGRVDIEYRRTDGKPERKTFASIEEFNRDWASRKVAVDPNSSTYRDMWEGVDTWLRNWRAESGSAMLNPGEVTMAGTGNPKGNAAAQTTGAAPTPARAGGPAGKEGQTSTKAPTLTQRQRGKFYQRKAQEHEASAVQAEAKASARPDRAERLRAVAATHRAKATRYHEKAQEFFRGGRSATEDIVPSPEEVDQAFAQAGEADSSLRSEIAPTGPKAPTSSRAERDPTLTPRLTRPIERGPHGGRMVYRVEGGGRRVVHIDANRNVRIQEGTALHLNFGSRARAEEFFAKDTRGSGTRMVAFEVDEEWSRSIRSVTTPEAEGAKALSDPQLVDVRFAEDQFYIPKELVPEMQDFIIPGSGQVIKVKR